MKKVYFSMGIISIAILASCTKDIKEPGELTLDQSINSEHLGVASGRQPGQSFMPNEILVKFKKGTSATGRVNALARISGKVQEHILTKAMERSGDNEGVYLVHTPLNALEAIAKAKGLEVEYAEPNWIYTHDATSVSDSYFAGNQLWGMYSEFSPSGTTDHVNKFGSHANTAWSKGHTGSASVYIGIIDEGIQYTHPDLSGQVWVNPIDQTVDGIDQDGSGYDGDINGWDFDGNDNTIYDGGTRGSLDDHGTHVAGTIGAKANNGTGVVGVNHKVTIISGKFLGRRGGTTANAIKAVDYFNTLKSKGINVIATNNSWGGGGFSTGLYDAIARANTAGVLFIAAAGNGGSDGVGDDNDKVANFPSNYGINNTVNGTLYPGLSNVIAVASITSTGAKSSFSNFGANSVHLGAPGSGIYSTTAYNTYSSYSGTSMATPHVTGAAALYAASNSSANASAIKKAIIDAAISTPTTSLSKTGSTPTITGGRLNASGF